MSRSMVRFFVSVTGLIIVLAVIISNTACVGVTSAAPQSTQSTSVSISISPSTISLQTGATQQFTATISGTSNAAVNWSASGGSITGSGNSVIFTAPAAAGTYTLTATSVADSTQSATAAITVSDAASSVSVSLNPASASLLALGAAQFTATVSGTNNTAVTWTATDGSISGTGNTVSYTAPASTGTFSVTATSVADPSQSATSVITVSAAPTISVLISPTSASLQAGTTQQFVATVSGTSNTAVTWTASAGTISSSGLYTAPASAGTYSVSATSAADTTKTAVATVTVVATPISVSISPTTVGVITDATQQFRATVTGTANTAVTWSASSGTMSSSGLFTAPSTTGSVTVKATSVADPTKSATATVQVSSNPNSTVAINPTSASLITGDTQQFTATVTGLSNTSVTWSATGGTISSSGLYTAPSTAGTYSVKATSSADSTKFATATVTVTTPIIVVSVSPSVVSLLEGATQQFSASVSGSSNSGVTWSATGGTISSSGLYTAPSTTGTYTIKATSKADSTKSASAAVTVTAPVSVSVSPMSASIQTRATQQFTAGVTGTSNTAVTWSTTGGSVSSSGLYTAPNTAGTYAVKATSVADSSKSATATVTVTAPVSVTVSPSSTSLQTGSTQQFTASVTGSSNTSVTWTATGGTVSSSGLYTAPNTAGTYTVKATSVADITKSATASVTVTAPTISVTVSPSTASLQSGATQQFSATVTGSTNTSVTWTATGGTVSSSGLYTAPSTAGTYTLKATSVADNTKSDTATVTVSAVGVSISPTSASIQSNGTKQFTATVTGSSNTSVTWSATGGTVSSTGLYTAPSTAGTYSVTATSAADNTKSASATVTVTAPAVSVSINPNTASVQTGATQQFTATVTGNSNTSVTWTATGGTVTSGGLYTAANTAGTYSVKATSVADSSKSASATVTVTAPAPVSVSVTPSSASLAPSGTATFTATVNNTSNTGVTWTTSGGSVSGTGNTITYTAPASTGSYTLTATSVADTNKSATATITDTNNATPSFEGFGANATGGSTVVHVTNTNASGSGSLASALSSSGRHIVFDVGGTISLGSSSLLIPANTFIDGFSAPSVVTITSSGSTDCLHVWNSNIIIQGIRVRNCGGDDIQIAGSSGAIANIVVDHVETESGGDGNIDVTESAHDVTVSWSIMANNSASGLQLVKYNSYHVSLHHNIYYNSFGNSRVPWCEGGGDAPQSGSTVDLGVICDVRYNIMSKWLIGTLFESDGRTLTYGNVVSNFYDGQDSSHARNNIAICPGGGMGSAFVAGNVSILNPAGTPYCNYSTAATVTTTNSPSNHAEYSVPGISGPTTTDAQGRVDEWNSVLNQAGVVTHFADDATASGIRAGITMPTTSMTSSSWNK